MITDAKLVQGELEFIAFGRERYRVVIQPDGLPILYLVEKIFQDDNDDDEYYSYRFEREARNISLIYRDLGKSRLGRWLDRWRLRRAARIYYSKKWLDRAKINTVLDAFNKPNTFPTNNRKTISFYRYDLKKGDEHEMVEER